MKYIKHIIIAFTIVLCIVTYLCAFRYYPRVLAVSKYEVKVKDLSENLRICSDTPEWFAISDSSIIAYTVISESEKNLLYKCVEPIGLTEDRSVYNKYIQAVNELVYKSNNDNSKIQNLLILTFAVVSLGCCARTFYDYIGWECYKGGQDMKNWWPWYFFRPFIGVPITTFLIVAFRTSTYSYLFKGKDLNTYLIVSFLAGFAMMEFLTMLRRTSKALFGNYDK